MSTDEQLLQRIVMNPEVMMGKPAIRGTRLTVEYILDRLAHGTATSSLLEEYEGLVMDDIDACLSFAKKAVASWPSSKI